VEWQWGPGNYILAKSFPVENGVNRFMIRSTTTPGTITVKASADGLKDAKITLVTKPFATQNGLATILPSAGFLQDWTGDQHFDPILFNDKNSCYDRKCNRWGPC
jgi:hypothetical protein